MINWTVRFKNKTFWLALIPAALLFIQAVAKVFGFELDFGELGNKPYGSGEYRICFTCSAWCCSRSYN